MHRQTISLEKNSPSYRDANKLKEAASVAQFLSAPFAQSVSAVGLLR